MTTKNNKSGAEIFPLTDERVSRLVVLASENNLHELTLSKGEESITVRCCGDVVAQPASLSMMQPDLLAPTQPEATEPKPSAEKKHSGTVVKSPMVGTVYLSSRPGAPQFVRAGEQVKKGQTMLIIEAMKVMNQISAPNDGVIAELLVTDKEPVEFDQELVVFRD